MDRWDDVLRSLGRIEGLLEGLPKLSDRVARLEMWQQWLKGGLCAIGGAFGYLFRVCRGL